MGKSNTILLVRVVVNEEPVWRKWGGYPTEEHAEADYRLNIKGKGVTAWAWWGPENHAYRLLAGEAFDKVVGADSE